MRNLISILFALAALNVFADDTTPTAPATGSKDSKFYEMRTYTAMPGKYDALRVRFRDLTNKLYVKHGMEIVGSWYPMTRTGERDNTIVYIFAYPSREARDKSWKEFSDDIEWLAVKTDTEQGGKLISKVDAVYMTGGESPMPASSASPLQ